MFSRRVSRTFREIQIKAKSGYKKHEGKSWMRVRFLGLSLGRHGRMTHISKTITECETGWTDRW
jgi:hypothetical protein